MLKIKLREETKWQVYFRILPDVGKQDSCFTKFDIWLLIRRSRFSSNFDFNFNFESPNGNFFFWKIYNKERKNSLNILICFYISFYSSEKSCKFVNVLEMEIFPKDVIFPFYLSFAIPNTSCINKSPLYRHRERGSGSINFLRRQEDLKGKKKIPKTRD